MARLTHLGGALATLILAACGPESSGPPPREVAERPHILLVSIDTLRADHLGAYGYQPYAEPVSPAIDQLAAQGARFTSCFAPRGQTVPSLTTMLVGKFPSKHGIRENSQTFRGAHSTLFEILGPLGYETAAFISYIPAHGSGNPARGAQTLELGFSVEPSEHQKSQWLWDRTVADKAIAWLDAMDSNRARPFLAWIHFYDVHRTYAPPPPYDRMFRGDYEGELLMPEGAHTREFQRIDSFLAEHTVANKALEPADHDYVVSLYDGGIRATDEHVRRILHKLAEKGLAEDTLVILTADHGEELADHQNYYFHGNSLFDGTLHIPLLMSWPGHVPAGVTVETLVQNVDLVPTILDLLGEPPPADLDGVSFRDFLTGSAAGLEPPRPYAFLEWQDQIYGVRSATHKFLDNPNGIHPKKPPYYGRDGDGFVVRCQELYDLTADPGETVNLAPGKPAVLDELRRRLREYQARPGQVRGWETTDDEETLKRLLELGYVGTLPGRPDILLGAEDCSGQR